MASRRAKGKRAFGEISNCTNPVELSTLASHHPHLTAGVLWRHDLLPSPRWAPSSIAFIRATARDHALFAVSSRWAASAGCATGR